MSATPLALPFGLAIGLLLGLVGGGGSIVAVPVLVYVLDQPVKDARPRRCWSSAQPPWSVPSTTRESAVCR